MTREEYEQHIELGECTATPQDGCVVCLEAVVAGLITDNYPNDPNEDREEAMY